MRVSAVLRCLLALAAGTVIAVAQWGCPGHGFGGSPPTGQTRERVMGIHRLSLHSFGLSGFAASGMFGTGGGQAGAMGGGESAGAGIPMLGAFVRGLTVGSVRTRDGGGGSSGGGGGEGDPPFPPPLYFDEWLGLWVQTESTSTSFQMRFFLDEEMRQPAGTMETTWPEEWNTYPQTYLTRYEFLAGSMAGSSGRYEFVMTDETDGHMSYWDEASDGSRSEGTSRWNDRGYKWRSRWDGADGTWCKDRGEFSDDGTGKTFTEDSNGYRLTYTYRADGSGFGRIEGPDPGLPATVTWDWEGNMRIVYADGTVEEFPGYGWIEPVSTTDEPGRRR